MSIPKEPRQLMINLMYLVLTALLALNVSASVMNAFFTLEKSMLTSNEIVTTSNEKVLDAIKKEAEAYEGDTLKQIALTKATQAKQIADDFDKYIEDIYTNIFDAAGGEDPKKPGSKIPKDKKNKDITTRLLVDGQPKKGVDPIGPQIYAKIIQTRDALKALVSVEKQETLESAMPLGRNIENWKEGLNLKKADKNMTWSTYKFRQMPVAAVIPILRSFQADAKTSASAVMNEMFAESKGEIIKFDAFFPVASAKSSYVLQGEKYEADIFLSAFSTAASESTKIYVNGREIPMEEGKGAFSTTGGKLGTNSYNVKIDVTNPLTQETDSYEQKFEFEVGQPSIAVAADQMNVFYIGVDNPVTVSAAGINSNSIKVSMTGEGGGTISKVKGSSYNVEVKKPTGNAKFAYVTVTGGPKPVKVPFRVKRIPDPVPALSPGVHEGNLGNGTFKAYQGVMAELKNFDFDARCNIQEYDLVRIANRQDPVTSQNKGAKYNSKSIRLVNQAKPGDTYYFRNIKGKCPGDIAGRSLPSMVFTIR